MIALLIIVAILVAFAILAHFAPEGYEDETGFHYGNKENHNANP